ncbi:hypothetical protein F0562_026420 [Nyssa sinensis]|uniref:COP1-interacting protein 7 n=1 Tax=Nyssa sinensis TaxID=561372 RepID=A0A5J5BAV0_9ASTE|nr:hypothetical protein F0562_026420 [Nyssa sinensis]
MEGGIDTDAALDYAEFQIFARQNRYEACGCSGNKVETLASGLLEHLLPHLPKLKDLYSKGSNINFRLQPPKNLDGVDWFTKSTLTRFLHIVGSPDILNITNAIENEISQLEESRRFHVSLYGKGHQDHFGSGETDGGNSNGMAPMLKAEVKIVSSDASKYVALIVLFSLPLSTCAAGTTCSPKDIADLKKFSQHVGAIELRNSLWKFVELSQKSQTLVFPSDDRSRFTHDSRNDSVSKSEGNNKVSRLSDLEAPVKYGVSPAKVAQVERQCSTESEESSHSSEEDRPSVERSRTLIRSASPRRSASPMRRVQIGRSGSRRATALTIKSLNYFPARERTLSHRDAATNSSEDEGSEQPSKKSESNVRRMSVQDAIHLFESKQRDQNVDVQKRSSFLDTSVSANKSVLRRWSAGHNAVETAEVDVNLDTSEKRASYPICVQADTLVIQKEENSEKLTSSTEWNRQKEAELNQMLMKMMESKPVRYQNMVPDNCRSQNVHCDQRGGFYDHYKEKRDEKLRGETAGKRAEKEAQFRAMQKILDKRKTEMVSSNITEVSKKHYLSKPQKSPKNLSQSTNPNKETSKPAVAKKASSKASPLPAVRKSWPSTPSPRATGTSPAKTSPSKTPGGTTSAGTTPNCRKPQPAPSISRSSPKVERSQQRPKNVKANKNDANKSMKGWNEKQQLTVKKTGKMAKTKVQTTSGEQSSMISVKPSFYGKVTKKSSVVPLESKLETKPESKLESKPFLRKGSRTGLAVAPAVVKTKVSSQPEESLRNSGNLIQDQENDVVTNTSNLLGQQQERDLEALQIHADLESETPVNCQQKCDDAESCDQVTADCDDSFKRQAESASKTEAEEEFIISPSAWVEIEELQDLPIPCDDSRCQIASPAIVAPVAMASPHVRHSLSQMLLEESNEPDIEWGNAENPPAMVYQKDAPKGLKRLLKFARKRTDASSTGWSSPSTFSEGDDDTEESKGFRNKNTDNLLRKAALYGRNHGQQKTSSSEGYEENSAACELLSAQSNISKFTAQSSSQLQEGHVSAAATTTKATRSFFSLSAFRGTKPSETKLR